MYNIILNYYNRIVKNLINKTQWNKTWMKGKRVQFAPLHVHIIILSLIAQHEDL